MTESSQQVRNISPDTGHTRKQATNKLGEEHFPLEFRNRSILSTLTQAAGLTLKVSPGGKRQEIKTAKIRKLNCCHMVIHIENTKESTIKLLKLMY